MNNLSNRKTFGFIVEGFNDERTLLKVLPNAKFAVTQGTRFNNRVKMDIRELLEQCDEVFILTDPDSEGDRIASTIQKEFNLERIEVDEKEAKCTRNRKVKTGVEHCDTEYLKQVLSPYLK